MTKSRVPRITALLISALPLILAADTKQCPPAGLQNKACLVTVDRKSPATPLAITVPPGTKVSLWVPNKSPFEAIKKDVTLKAVEPPDQLSFLVQTLLPFLNSLPFPTTTGPHTAEKAILLRMGPKPANPDEINRYIHAIHELQENIATSLKNAKTAAEDRQAGATEVINQDWTISDRRVKLTEAAEKQAAIIGAALACNPHGDLCLPSLFITDHWIKVIGKLIEAAPEIPEHAGPNLAVVIRDQESLSKSLKSLNDAIDQLATFQALFATLAKAAAKESDSDCAQPAAADKGFLFCQTFVIEQPERRQATVGIKAVSSLDKAETKLVDGFTITWLNQPRFTLSGGAMFSTVAKHQFSTQPIAASGQDQTTLKYQITEAITRPQVVPFTFVNLRMMDGYTGGRYWSVSISPGLGVNPNSSPIQTEFALGPSIGIGSVYFTLGAHFARPLALATGFQPGNAVGSSFAPPTHDVWRTGFGIAISYKLIAK